MSSNNPPSDNAPPTQHNAVSMDFDANSKRRKSSSSEEDGEVLLTSANKKSKDHQPTVTVEEQPQNKPRLLHPPFPGTSNNDSHTPHTSLPQGPHGDVILIKYLDGKFMDNPNTAMHLLHQSPFQKYILDHSVTILGKGNGIRIQVQDQNGRLPSLDTITHLGDGTIPVKCWVAGQKPTLQGKIYPVCVDIPIEDIKSNIEVL